MSPLTARLAAYATNVRYADLPEGAREAAANSLLDLVGVMVAATTLGEGCRPFIDQARTYAAVPEASLLTETFRTPAPFAALAHGALAHAIDFEDAYDAAPLHPNTASIPAALALIERHGPVSGQDLLAAVAVSCDLTCRLGLALTNDPADAGWYTPPILGAIGAATAAGCILKLDARAMADAWSLAMHYTCSGELKFSPDSHIRAVRDGFAAQMGVQAAQLAARGVRGFDAPFDGAAGLFALYAGGGFDPAALTDDLGERFEGANVTFKKWPSCRATHAYVEAAFALFAAHDLRPGDIAGFTMTGGALQQKLCEPAAQKLAPATAIDAKFSLPFSTAMALVHGEVTLDRFAPDALADPAILAMAKLARFERFDRPMMAASGALALRLKDGREVSVLIEHPKGHPLNPLSADDLKAKFVACVGYAAKPVADPAAWADRLLAIADAPDAAAVVFGG